MLQAWTTGIQCQICHMRFLDQSAINAHYDAVHTGTTPRARAGEGTHACDVCERRFSSKGYLRHHLAAVHGVGKARIFKCDVCSREFNVKSNLSAHIKRLHKSWGSSVAICLRAASDATFCQKSTQNVSTLTCNLSLTVWQVTQIAVRRIMLDIEYLWCHVNANTCMFKNKAYIPCWRSARISS